MSTSNNDGASLSPFVVGVRISRDVGGKPETACDSEGRRTYRKVGDREANRLQAPKKPAFCALLTLYVGFRRR